MRHQATYLRAFIFLAGCLIALRVLTLQASAQVINEVLPNPSDPQDASEWIELYNPTHQDMQLTGYVLDDIEGNSTGPFDLTGLHIVAFGYLVIEKQLSKLALNNDYDQVRLIDPTGKVIDSVEFSDIPTDHSYARSLDGKGEWVVTNKPTKNASNSVTPQPTNTSQYKIAEKLEISELFPCPADGQKEWVEILNPTDQMVSLEGWKIRDISNNQVELTGTITARAYKLFEWTRSILNNAGDTLYLINPHEDKHSTVTYETCKTAHSFIFQNEAWRITSQTTPGGPNKFTAAVQENSQKDTKPTTKSQPSITPLKSQSDISTVDAVSDSVNINYAVESIISTRSGVASVAGIINVASQSASNSSSLTFDHKSAPVKDAKNSAMYIASGLTTIAAGFTWLHKKHSKK